MAESDFKAGGISFTGNLPMEFRADGAASLSEEQKGVADIFGDVMRAYLRSAKQLLDDEFSHLRPFVPPHLGHPVNLLVAISPEGVILRYELSNAAESKLYVGWVKEPLAVMAMLLSQGLLRCHLSSDAESTIATDGMELKFSVVEAKTGTSRDILSLRLGFDAVVEQPKRYPAAPHKPYCLVSIRNSLEIGIQGVMADANSA